MIMALQKSVQNVIPKDAPLYPGTVGQSLDPMRENTDAELIDVLKRGSNERFGGFKLDRSR